MNTITAGMPRLLRGLTKLSQMLQLQAQSFCSRRSVTGDAGVVVSLTTFGKRFQNVHLTIESIARGATLPSRMILWIDDPALLANPTPGLKRLQKRGLEIRSSKNYGPHTKYFPYAISETSHKHALVTSDDDTIYPKRWLSSLVTAHTSRPDLIHCHRARGIKIEKAEGLLAPYIQWDDLTNTHPSHRVFFLGVSGVIYPSTFLDHLRDSGELFREHLLHVDDIWLNLQALVTATKAAQVSSTSGRFPLLLGSQESALSHENVLAGRNDIALAHAYTAEAIRLLALEE